MSFTILDNAIQSKVGHFFEFDVSVMEAAERRGHQAQCLTNVDLEANDARGFEPHFHAGFWGRSQNVDFAFRLRAELHDRLRFLGRPTPRIDELLEGPERKVARIYADDLLAFLEKHKPGAGDVLFFPNFNVRDAVALLDMPDNLVSAPQMRLLFRRDLDESPGQKNLLGEALQRDRANLRYFVDTERLKTQYEAATGNNFTVLPIPFRHTWLKEAPEPHADGPVKILYIGGPRDEKGFLLLPQLVRDLAPEREAGKVVFVVHAYPAIEPPIAQAVDELRALAGVELVEEHLDAERYYGLIQEADAVYVNYDAARYRARSSCIFIESLVAGRPVVVSAGSWMESELPAGAGVVVAQDDELAQRVRGLISEIASYQAAAVKAMAETRRKHNPDELVRILLGNPR